MRNILTFLTAALLAIVLYADTQTGIPALRKVTSFDLPGQGGKRFDYLQSITTITTFSLLISLPGRLMSSIWQPTRLSPRLPTHPVLKEWNMFLS